MNLRPRGQGMVEDGSMMWEEIGVWKSLNAEKINIKVICPRLLKRTVSEFNEFEPSLKSAKNRFQLSAGLNLETLNTI